ncbi:MAG: hypothetical protein H8E17_17340 [Deltaproteobacteria bacterium]|nr:hypothetical protein [Deltaproteobacteria bacterium]
MVNVHNQLDEGLRAACQIIQKQMKHFDGDANNRYILECLELALSITEGNMSIAKTRQRARRAVQISVEDVMHLSQMANQVGSASYIAKYTIMEIIQAASVAKCGLRERNIVSSIWALAASNVFAVEHARQAYADVIEGLQIVKRFFDTGGKTLSLERTMRGSWEKIKHHSKKHLDIFDPADIDPSHEWFDLIIWNSDFGEGKFLLGQVDATIRLSVRMHHWVDTLKQPLESPVKKILNYCKDMISTGDSWLAARCMMTLADALMELKHWDLGAKIHHDIPLQTKIDINHPICIHSKHQEAYCSLMLGKPENCHAIIQSMETEFMEKMAEFIITYSAEKARHIALKDMCRRRYGMNTSGDAREQIDILMQNVQSITSADPRNRSEHLYNLFVGVLNRDLILMLSDA